MVVSASASNRYYLRAAVVNNWPTHYINKGFADAEALVFLAHRKFFALFEKKEVSNILHYM